MRNWIPPVLLMLLALALLEIVSFLNWVPAFLLPPPHVLLSSFIELKADLLPAAWQSFYCAFIGFILSAFFGFFLALTLSMSAFLSQGLHPFVVFFQTVPIVAIAPLMVVWFGFGVPTTVASSLIVSFFPVLANSLAGFNSCPKELLELFKIYKASKIKILFYLKIPSAAPFYFASLKVSAGLAVVGTIVGEFVGGGGLGSLIDAAMRQQRADIVFLCAILASGIGLFMISVVGVFEQLMNKWRPLS